MRLVKVCDAIMGSGKTEAAITYINEHPEEKFVYITPYLDEARRIKNGCPDAHFVEPSNKIGDYDFKKIEHTEALIEEGRNIASTHAAFKSYSRFMLDKIREHGYTLIIDESVDVLQEFDYHPDDLQLTLDSGWVEKRGDTYCLKEDKYHGWAISKLFTLLRSRNLVEVENGKAKDLFFWTLPCELITSFKEVIVLTYMFEGQSLKWLFDIYHIPYDYIGIHRSEDGRYSFSDTQDYYPSCVLALKDRIHILDNDRLNSIGKNYHALSINWFKNNSEGVEQLKRNIYNCFRNVWEDSNAKNRLWGTYSSGKTKLRGKGYTKAFLMFNAKATNEYRNRKYLIYAANPFMNVNEKKFYYKHGIDVDEDLYALSIMIQWIWRSAIRCGEEIYIYIPSRRMRSLLMNWMDEVTRGGTKAG